jgi:hypothetical protein
MSKNYSCSTHTKVEPEKTLMSVNLAATFAKTRQKSRHIRPNFRAPSLFAILKSENAENLV